MIAPVFDAKLGHEVHPHDLRGDDTPIPEPLDPSGWYYIDASVWGTIKVSLDRNRNFLTEAMADAELKGDVSLARHFLWGVRQTEAALLAISNPEGI